MNITVDGVTRPMTDEEKTLLDEARLQVASDLESGAIINSADKESIAAAKESAKAKLAALGLTEEEVNAIIGGV